MSLPERPRDHRLPPKDLMDESYLVLLEQRDHYMRKYAQAAAEANENWRKIETLQEAWRIITGQEVMDGEG